MRSQDLEKLQSDLAGTRTSGCAQILDFSGMGYLYWRTMPPGYNEALEGLPADPRMQWGRKVSKSC